MRNFVLVTATRTEPDKTPVTGSGIRKLKRGVGMATFIREYLESVGVHHDDTDMLLRDGTWTVLLRTPGAAFSWNLTEYPEGDLITAVSHLTRDELLRDLKELLPLKAME
jgi:hypothetical protein